MTDAFPLVPQVQYLFMWAWLSAWPGSHLLEGTRVTPMAVGHRSVGRYNEANAGATVKSILPPGCR